MNAHWPTLFLIGAALAALMAIALWRQSTRIRSPASANRVLASWLTILVFDLGARAVYLESRADAALPWYAIAQLLPFIHGSMFFLYVSVLTESRPLRIGDLHVTLGLLAALIWNRKLFAIPTADAHQLFAGNVPTVHWQQIQQTDLALFVYSLSYVLAALTLVVRYRGRLLQSRSDGYEHEMHWLLTMAVGQLAIWLVALMTWLTPFSWIDSRAIYATVTAWVVSLAYLALTHPGSVPATTMPARAAEPIDLGRAGAVDQRISELMSDRIYLQPDLSIAELAAACGEPEYLVSAVINQRHNANFCEFINRRRVEEAQRLLLSTPHRPILDIAFEAGFSSKTTFNKVFKQATGLTPSVWRQTSSSKAQPAAD